VWDFADVDSMKPQSVPEAAVEQERYKLTTYDCENDRHTPVVRIYSLRDPESEGGKMSGLL